MCSLNCSAKSHPNSESWNSAPIWIKQTQLSFIGFPLWAENSSTWAEIPFGVYFQGACILGSAHFIPEGTQFPPYLGLSPQPNRCKHHFGLCIHRFWAEKNIDQAYILLGSTHEIGAPENWRPRSHGEHKPRDGTASNTTWQFGRKKKFIYFTLY